MISTTFRMSEFQPAWVFEPHDPALAAIWHAVFIEARDNPDRFAERLDDPADRSLMLAMLATGTLGEAGNKDDRLCASLRGNGPEVEEAVGQFLDAIAAAHSTDERLLRSIFQIEGKLLPHRMNAQSAPTDLGARFGPQSIQT